MEKPVIYTNNYIPYRTTLNAGDVLRNPFSVADYLAKSLVNYFWSRHALLTGYTQQDYATMSLDTIQHFSRPDLRKIVPLTVGSDQTSNKPVDGMVGSVVSNSGLRPIV